MRLLCQASALFLGCHACQDSTICVFIFVFTLVTYCFRLSLQFAACQLCFRFIAPVTDFNYMFCLLLPCMSGWPSDFTVRSLLTFPLPTYSSMVPAIFHLEPACIRRNCPTISLIPRCNILCASINVETGRKFTPRPLKKHDVKLLMMNGIGLLLRVCQRFIHFIEGCKWPSVVRLRAVHHSTGHHTRAISPLPLLFA